MRTHFSAARPIAPFILVVAACGSSQDAARAPRPSAASSAVAAASNTADEALQRDLDQCRLDSAEASCAAICKRAETAKSEGERSTANDACDAAASIRDEDQSLRWYADACESADVENSCDDLRLWITNHPKRHVDDAKASLARGEASIERHDWHIADARWCRAAPSDLACEGVEAYLAKYPAGLHAASAKSVLAAAAPKLATFEDRVSAVAKATGVTIRKVRLLQSLEPISPDKPGSGAHAVGDVTFEAHRETSARARSVKVTVSCLTKVGDTSGRLQRSIDVPLVDGLVRARLLVHDDNLSDFSACDLAIEVAALRGPSQSTTFCWDEEKLREGTCKTKLVVPEPPPHAVVKTASGELAAILQQSADDGVSCYEDELDGDPKLTGVVECDVRVRDGKVERVQVVSSKAGPALEACLTAELRQGSWPKTSGEGRVRYSFELR
jgi:hypothetical protein